MPNENEYKLTDSEKVVMHHDHIRKLKSLKHNLSFLDKFELEDVSVFRSIKNDLPSMFPDDMKDGRGFNMQEMMNSFMEHWNTNIDRFVKNENTELKKLLKE
jgi:hypothetical protein